MNILRKLELSLANLTWALAIDEQQKCFRLLLLRQRKRQISILGKYEEDSLEACIELIEKLPAAAVVLSLRLKNITEGLIRLESEDPISDLLGAQVPNKTHLLTQYWPARDGYQWLCVVNKDAFMKWFYQLDDIIHRIVHINLSPISKAWLLPLIPEFNEHEAYSWQAGISWQSGILGLGKGVEVEHWEEKMAQSLSLPPEYLDAFAALIQCSLKEGSQEGLGLKKRRSFLQKRQLTRLILLGILLSLFSLAVFNGVNKLAEWKSEKLRSQLHSHEAELEEIESNATRIYEEQKFIENLHHKRLKDSQVAYFLDEILSVTLPGIGLKKLQIRPETKQAADSVDIFIAGSASQAGTLASFSEALKNLDFIAAINLQESSFSSQDQHYNFSLTAQFRQP